MLALAHPDPKKAAEAYDKVCKAGPAGLVERAALYASRRRTLSLHRCRRRPHAWHDCRLTHRLRIVVMPARGTGQTYAKCQIEPRADIGTREELDLVPWHKVTVTDKMHTRWSHT